MEKGLKSDLGHVSPRTSDLELLEKSGRMLFQIQTVGDVVLKDHP